jgi:hypothetical protein
MSCYWQGRRRRKPALMKGIVSLLVLGEHALQTSVVLTFTW